MNPCQGAPAYIVSARTDSHAQSKPFSGEYGSSFFLCPITFNYSPFLAGRAMGTKITFNRPFTKV